METLNNQLNFFVIPNVDNVIADADTFITGIADLNDGQFYWTTPAGRVVDSGGTYDPDAFPRLKLTGRIGSQLVVSDVIDVNTIKRYSITSYAAPAEQLDYIGYNGTAGSIEAIDDNVYMLSIHILNRNQTDFGRQKVLYGTYESDATCAQSEVAIGVTGNLLASLKNQKPDQYVAPKAICNVAVNAAYDLTNTSTVVNGSDTFAVATNLTYNTAAGTLVVGDFVRFADALNGTLALVNDVYEVIAINTLDVTVDRPIQVPSGAWTDAGDGIQVITAAQAAAADWGIKLLGIAKSFTVGSTPYEKVRWYNGLRNFGTTTETNTTGASEGSGFWQAVETLEWVHGKGGQGEWYKTRSYAPAPTQRSVTDSTTPETYDIMTVHFENQMTEVLGQANNSPCVLELALAVTDNGANQIVGGTDASTALITLFEDWAITNWAVPGLTSQTGNLT